MAPSVEKKFSYNLELGSAAWTIDFSKNLEHFMTIPNFAKRGGCLAVIRMVRLDDSWNISYFGDLQQIYFLGRKD